MTFGGKPSVQNFDIVGATIKELALTKCEIPAKLVHRQLDDVPVVAPEKTRWCQEFSTTYTELCKEINMELAPDCKNNDKAFTCQKKGKVLGIIFDTENLSWSLPESKKQKTLAAIKNARESEGLGLKEIQKLMGRLNHVSQMAPFLNGFRHNLNGELKKAGDNFPNKIKLSNTSLKDLSVWSNFLSDTDPWLPIPHPRESPPLCTKNFVSDAAGFTKTSKWDGDIGCGIVGLGENGDTILAHQIFWPRGFIEKAKDRKGARFGDKTCTLEAIGVILPFLLIPEKLKSQHIVCGVDCMGVVFGWENKKIKGDTCASILIKALHIIEAYLGSRIHVIHAPRRSDWVTESADNLSRQRTTGFLEKQMLSRGNTVSPQVITDWLSNPMEDWTLVDRLVDHVIAKC
jgi:hypothetical protein